MLCVAAGSAAIGLLMARAFARKSGTRLDARVQCLALRNTGPRIRTVARVLTPPAFPLIYMPASVLAARALMRRGNRSGRAVPIAAALVFASYHILKHATQRRRPPSKREKKNYREAYPSGHMASATAVALATAIAMRDNRRRPPSATLALIGAGIPIAIGASRIVLDEHWFTDVLGGAAVGTAAATTASAIARRYAL